VIVHLERRLAGHHVQRRAFLWTRFVEEQRAGGEIERRKPDLGGRLCPFRPPLEPAGDHQMENEKQLAFHLPHDPFSNAPQADHRAALGRGERRIDGAEQRGTHHARARERLPHDPWSQRLEINRDVGKLRHPQSLNTCSATSTRPNGALTCTPCTICLTRANISRAIATPSASAASFPLSCAFRMRCSTSSGTDTPGTSFARNSALRRLISGQIPATIGILNCSTRCRNASSWRASNTGCVTANSAPASTFHANRDSSRSMSLAPGFTPTPMAHFVAPPSGLLPGSSPWFNRYTRLVRPIESMSNTAVASG